MSEIVFPKTPWSDIPRAHRAAAKKILEDAAWERRDMADPGLFAAAREALRVLTMAEHPGAVFNLPDPTVVRY